MAASASAKMAMVIMAKMASMKIGESRQRNGVSANIEIMKALKWQWRLAAKSASKAAASKASESAIMR